MGQRWLKHVLHEQVLINRQNNRIYFHAREGLYPGGLVFREMGLQLANRLYPGPEKAYKW